MQFNMSICNLYANMQFIHANLANLEALRMHQEWLCKLKFVQILFLGMTLVST